jgi:hypothetical protein
MRSSVAAATLLASAPGAREWSRYTLTDPAALCLDGSPGAYYVLPGVGEAAADFVIHLQGGGWCVGLDNCTARAFDGPVYKGEPSLGSSTAWGPGPCTPALSSVTPPCVADGGSGGLLSSNSSVNPTLWAATKVWAGYCSGDSFAGAQPLPIKVNATASIFFRGDAILRATIAALVADHGMGDATAVLLKGCSAGGTAVFTQADVVGALVAAAAPRARFAALPGAGVFLDAASFTGVNTVELVFRWIFDAANLAQTGSAACHAAFGPTDAWRCLFAANALLHMRSDVFVANSLVDAASQSFIMGLPCDPASGACSPAALAYLDGFSRQMIANLSTVLAPGSRHGAFLVTCSVHMIENVDGAVDAIRVGGRTLADVFRAFWTRDASAPHVAVDAVWTRGTGKVGGNPDCGNYGPLPSRPGGVARYFQVGGGD